MAYLFLFIVAPSSGFNKKEAPFSFNDREAKAYQLILALEFEKATALLHDESLGALYLKSLSESLELVISENNEKYEGYEEHHDERLSQIKEIRQNTAAKGFFVAEMNIHSAFVDLKFGHEFKAAWQIKRAYKIISENQRNFPGFIYNNKTLGLLHVMIGSVPQKYQWIVSLFGMKGSIESGMKELDTLSNTQNYFQVEAKIIQSMIYSYLLGKPATGIHTFGKIYDNDPDNQFLAYLNILLLMKNQQSATAEVILKEFQSSTQKIPLMNYVGGEIYLQKGEFDRSRKLYEDFLKKHKGKSNIKDAHYKIFLTSYLSNAPDSESLRQTAVNAGEDITEADKYASRVLSLKTDPHPLILKIRLLTDGGFYDSAEKLIADNTGMVFNDDKNKAEYAYRKARLAHSQNQFDKAIDNYLKTLELSENNPWYFAPNSCLLLGNLMELKTNKIEAEKYYKMVFNYKGYEYQRSIENKAKRALEALN